MNTTGIFKCHHQVIKIPKMGQPINIVPFGDVHRFAPLCNVDKWHESLDRMKSLPKDSTYFLGMGDYDDLISASERAIFANPKIHESTKQTLDDFADSKTYELAKELDFMRGRIIGMLGGNHYYEYPSGQTSDHKLCGHLDTTFLGVSSVIRLSFVVGTKRCSLDMWAHHGKGASRLIGGSINRVEQMREAVDADVYLMGHDHQRAAVPVNMMTPTMSNCGRFEVVPRTQWLCRTGSFLNAMEDGKPSYIVDAARGPVNQGHIELEVTMKRKQVTVLLTGGKKVKDDRIWLDVKARI